MELSFRDGKKETIFKSATEETDGWYEKYCGDCNYALHLAEKLSAQGVVGTMADRERLENVMKDYDPQIKEGFAKLVAVMGVK